MPSPASELPNIAAPYPAASRSIPPSAERGTATAIWCVCGTASIVPPASLAPPGPYTPAAPLAPARPVPPARAEGAVADHRDAPGRGRIEVLAGDAGRRSAAARPEI